MDQPVLTLTNIDFTGLYDCFADNNFQLSALYGMGTLDQSIIIFLKANYTVTDDCANRILEIMKEVSGPTKVSAMEILWQSNQTTRMTVMWEGCAKEFESLGWVRYDK